MRPDLSVDDANDIFTAVVSPFVYREMIVNSGWEPDRFEAWLKSALRQLLLADASQEGSPSLAVSMSINGCAEDRSGRRSSHSYPS